MATLATIKTDIQKTRNKKHCTSYKLQLKKLEKAVPSCMSAERLARIAVTTIRLNPKLAECTPQSFLGALFQSAQLG